MPMPEPTTERPTFWEELRSWIEAGGEVPERRWIVEETPEGTRVLVLSRLNPMAPLLAPVLWVLPVVVGGLFLKVGITLAAGAVLGAGNWADALLWKRIACAAGGVVMVAVAIGVLFNGLAGVWLFVRNLTGREDILVGERTIRVERRNFAGLGPWEYFLSDVSGLRVGTVPRMPWRFLLSSRAGKPRRLGSASTPSEEKQREAPLGAHCIAFDHVGATVRLAQGLREREAEELLAELVRRVPTLAERAAR